jgi:hypothetical protein
LLLLLLMLLLLLLKLLLLLLLLLLLQHLVLLLLLLLLLLLRGVRSGGGVGGLASDALRAPPLELLQSLGLRQLLGRRLALTRLCAFRPLCVAARRRSRRRRRPRRRLLHGALPLALDSLHLGRRRSSSLLLRALAISHLCHAIVLLLLQLENQDATRLFAGHCVPLRRRRLALAPSLGVVVERLTHADDGDDERGCSVCVCEGAN